eukprot:6109528-Pyramimonas_sp.AAC.1
MNGGQYVTRNRTRGVLAISHPKPAFFLPQPVSDRNPNASKPKAVLARRNMQRIVSAIGRGIASPSANPRRPPSPNR